MQEGVPVRQCVYQLQQDLPDQLEAGRAEDRAAQAHARRDGRPTDGRAGKEGHRGVHGHLVRVVGEPVLLPWRVSGRAAAGHRGPGGVAGFGGRRVGRVPAADYAGVLIGAKRL